MEGVLERGPRDQVHKERQVAALAVPQMKSEKCRNDKSEASEDKPIIQEIADDKISLEEALRNRKN